LAGVPRPDKYQCREAGSKKEYATVGVFVDISPKKYTRGKLSGIIFSAL
jgi:hypothetical protein